MTKRNKTMVAIPVEIIPRGPDAIAAEYKAMIAKIVEEKVREALTHPTDSDFQPFFQSKQVTDEIKRRQTVTEQHKFSYAYEDWGCLACGTKERPHGSLWMCADCYRRALGRLKSSIRRHSPDEPLPSFRDTVKLARAALAPSIETLAFAGRRKGGRPKVIRDPAKIAAVTALRSQGLSWARVSLEMGISVSTARALALART